MKRALVLLGIGLIGIGAFAQITKPPQIRVELTVNPQNYTGPGPVTLQLGASIRTSVVTTLTARFVDSKGRGTTPRTLKFAVAGSQSLKESLAYDLDFDGWIAVEISPGTGSPLLPAQRGLAANKFLSDKITVSLHFNAPKISSVTVESEGEPPRELEMHGLNFGAVQGNRKILIDGETATIYSHWADTDVIFGRAAILEPDHLYSFVMTNGASAISNTFQTKFLMSWDGAAPSSAPVGAEVVLRLFMVAPTQGVYVVKMGTITMPVLSWSGSPSLNIRIRVPSAAPGVYQITVQKGGVPVTKGLAFTVTP